MVEESITDMLTKVTQPDLIVLAAGIGGVLMWANWYRKGTDRDHLFNIDTENKRIKIGLYVSALIGMLSGSAVGFLANTKGWAGNDSALVAFFVGLLSTWTVKTVLNNSYNGVCKLAQSKWFSDNVGSVIASRQPKALPEPTAFGKSLSTTMQVSPTLPARAAHFKEQKAALTEHFVLLKNRGSIDETEMLFLHRLIPDVEDVVELQATTQGLAQQQQNITIGQKTDLTNIILTQQRQLNKATSIIDVQQDKLERAGLTMEPQNRIPREVLYVSVGVLARHFLGWLL